MTQLWEALMSDALTLKISGPVAQITINRPDKRNAFDTPMWQALIAHCAKLGSDPVIKTVVLGSASLYVFSAGADISEFDRLRQDPAAITENALLIEQAMNALHTLPRPTIAQIDGTCFGGGAALALCCDFRVAGPTAKFAIPPARLGLSYSAANVRRLADAVGVQMARRMLMLVETLDARTALDCGLIDRLTDTTATETTQDLIKALNPLSQYSVRALKHTVLNVSETTDMTFLEAYTGVDLAEGMSAFLEKRKPKFPFA